jgi:hypothetical protein
MEIWLFIGKEHTWGSGFEQKETKETKITTGTEGNDGKERPALHPGTGCGFIRISVHDSGVNPMRSAE